MPQASVKVTLNGYEVSISRARLGLFLELERNLHDLSQAVKERNSGGVVVALHTYLREASGEPLNFEEAPWQEIINAFFATRAMNSLPEDLPMLKYPFRGKENSAVPWDHPQRPFIIWIHVIANNYGWSLTEIESLWPEDAATYVQEIVTDEQLRKEWEHMLSPVTHSHDKNGKDLFTPLMRPNWMSSRPRLTLIPKEVLPQGVVVNISGVEKEDLDV